MKQVFQSNINCSSCERMVSQTLNENPHIKNWSVDLNHSEKRLSIEGTISKDELTTQLKALGFEIKAI